jgi:hypothetical protein
MVQKYKRPLPKEKPTPSPPTHPPDLIILMGANPLLGPLEGVGPENRKMDLPPSKSFSPEPYKQQVY